MLRKLRTLLPDNHPLRMRYSRLKGFLVHLRYKDYSKHMVIIGITGTDGKTTTSMFVAQLLEKLGYKVGLTCSQEHWFGKHKSKNLTKRTTPSPQYVKQFLKKCHRAGCTHVVIETSSHALQQSRILGVQYDIGAITNLTQEHGDYHPNMDHYAKTKAKLFRMVKGSRKTHKLLIVNAKMDYRDLFANIAPEITSFFAVDHHSISINIVHDDGFHLEDKMNLLFNLAKEHRLHLEKNIDEMVDSYEQERIQGKDYLGLFVQRHNGKYAGLCVGRAASYLLAHDYFSLRFSQEEFLKKLKKHQENVDFEKVFHLYGMYLEKEIRGHNYGSKLLAAFEANAQQKGYDYMLIDVQQSRDHLLSRYKRHDYVPLLSYDNGQEECVLLLKKLSIPTKEHLIKNHALQCVIQEENMETSRFSFGLTRTPYETKLHVPGSYNVDNIAIAILIAHHCGSSFEDIAKEIPHIRPVSGRLQQIHVQADFQVFLDFAVTPGALEAVLKHAKASAEGQVWSVFGCTGGNHDRVKRPLMGAAAETHADQIILTEDESYGEDVAEIFPAILSGMKDPNKAHTIADRKNAIFYALNHAKKGDVVIITGMGDLASRNSGGVEVAWSDADVVMERSQEKNAK